MDLNSKILWKGNASDNYDHDIEHSCIKKFPFLIEIKLCLLLLESLHATAPEYLRHVYCTEIHSSAFGLRLRIDRFRKWNSAYGA